MKGSALIEKYFPELTAIQRSQFSQLENIYKDWNSKINVISRKDIDNLYERHVLHSLGIAKIIQFKNGTKILDVGTGGGFPGIPLAILYPDCKFHLLDSIGKKIKVVNTVVESLGLKNVLPEWGRVENLKGEFDFVVSRAVAELPVLYQWVKNKISRNSFNDLPNGVLAFKGGELSTELKLFKNRVQIFNLEKFFKDEYFHEKRVVFVS